MVQVALGARQSVDCCKNFLVTGDRFRSFTTNKVFRVENSLTCTSSNVVYLAQCVDCGLQGVGSSVNFKRRLANYKSHIKHRRRTCGIVNHFLDYHDADHSTLKFMLILSRRVLPVADVASPSLAGHIFRTILHPYTQHTLLDSLENLLLDGI